MQPQDATPKTRLGVASWGESWGGPPAQTNGVEPWCVEVSTVSTVSGECRVGVEWVSVDTSVEVSGVSEECRRRS